MRVESVRLLDACLTRRGLRERNALSHEPGPGCRSALAGRQGSGCTDQALWTLLPFRSVPPVLQMGDIGSLCARDGTKNFPPTTNLFLSRNMGF